MGAVKRCGATRRRALMPSIPPPVPARPEGEAGRRVDRISRHATAEGDEVVGPLVRPTRCMTPNPGSAHREGRAGRQAMAIPWLRRRSTIHGRTSPSGRSDRLISPSASSRGIGATSAKRRSGRAGNGSASASAGATSVALRSMQGQSLVADSPAARHGGSVRSGKPSATTSPRTSATVLGIRLGDHGHAIGRTRKAVRGA